MEIKFDEITDKDRDLTDMTVVYALIDVIDKYSLTMWDDTRENLFLLIQKIMRHHGVEFRDMRDMRKTARERHTEAQAAGG